MPIQQGMNQQTPAVINTIRRVVGTARRVGSAVRRARSAVKGRRKSGKKRSGGALREYKVKSKRATGKLPKFGSKAWRKRFKLDKKK